MASDVETITTETLIKPTDREKILAKLEGFKIATAKAHLTAKEKEELDEVAKTFTKFFVYLCWSCLRLSRV